MQTTPQGSRWIRRMRAALAPSRLALTAYVASVILFPIAVTAAIVSHRGGLGRSHEEIAILTILAISSVVAERARTDLFNDSSLSIAFVPLFATAILLGPVEAAIVGAIGMLVSRLVLDPIRIEQALFSAAAVATAALAGSAGFHIVAGEAMADQIVEQLLPAVGAGLVVYIVNTALVTGAISIDLRRGLLDVWFEKFRWLAPHYLAFSVAAYAMASAYTALGIAGIAIFSLPAGMLWFGVRQYLERTRENVVRLREQSVVLSRSEQRFRSLVENAPGIVAVVNGDGTMQSLIPQHSGGGLRRSGPTAQLESLVHASDLSRFRAVLADMSGDPEFTVELEMRMRANPDADWGEYVAVLKNLTDTPAVGGVVVTAHDVTERKALERQLRHQAFHDPLTQLPNRALFTDRLEHALSTVNSRGGRVAVMYVDLDRFKTVNDTFGHHVGDDLLVAVAQRMTPAIRAGDTLARFGGDEFTVVLDGVEDLREVEDVAARIHESVAAPFDLGDQRITITVSIGLAISDPEAQISARDLTRNADVALFHAKEEGRDRTEVFSDQLDPYTLERYQLERDLREAVEKGEILLYYQPEVDMMTRRVVGFEALVRWQHPTRGLVPPDDFIPLAEETGTITDLGRWILDEACRQAAEWQETLFQGRHFTMGVNLSAPEFFEPDLIERVSRALETTGLNPASLRVEITESVLLGESSVADRIFNELKDLGVELAIDDFGTGYSSFGYLRRLPADIIKVDRSFVSAIDRDEREISIVRAVIAVAEALGMGVTVEGIEREEQVAIMTDLGARNAQGYLFSPPRDAAAAEAFARSAGEGRVAA